MEEKTMLQKVVEQKAEQIRSAIERAIDDGAKIVNVGSATHLLKCCRIDGIHLQKSTSDDTLSVVLNFRSEKIAKLFEPSRKDLERRVEELRAELNEIEKQLNSK